MENNVIVIDNISPWLRSVADNASAWKRKALKSVGWFMQQQIKRGIKSGAPGGQQYVRFATTDYMRDRLKYGPEGGHLSKGQRRSLRRRARVAGAGRAGPLGKLSQVIRYAYDDGQEMVETGWLDTSPKLVEIGIKQEQGFEKSVTERTRNFFLKSGLYINPSKTKIVIPARPTFDPMHRYLDPKIAPYMEKKIFEYMDKGAPADRNTPSFPIFSALSAR